ncbi:gliding motility-associated peptidyl-prolyl isomerase GldI [Aquimarina agarivorans]|uniref:gliding motility-associated peptidyl-prolyl isomerase GldI n=1 Tax=Aquimarina agarivorans TaxID=980584 RepID=UPI000248F5BA|nr:gliding motility-associated peptidyl-prolyl isomerase GldI [Aquimarina agarivorans]
MKYLFLSLITIFCLFSCSKPVTRKPVSVKSGSYLSESVILNKKIKAREETAINTIIEKDTLHTYLNSGNGFWYYYSKKDSIPNIKPQFGDIVNFDFNLKRINGSLIYSKKELGNRNYRMDKEELFYGLREALKLLQSGESATFLIPSHLAYGYYGDTKKIEANTPIITEVTVNSISKIEK